MSGTTVDLCLWPPEEARGWPCNNRRYKPHDWRVRDML